jgi:hypothetical protein
LKIVEDSKSIVTYCNLLKVATTATTAVAAVVAVVAVVAPVSM